MANQAPRWRRHLLEGATIVASILLAFGIDAWWDAYQEGMAVERQLQTLASDMEANRESLQQVYARGESNLGATKKLMSLMGPQPDPITVDSLASLLDNGFNLYEAALEVAALAGLLDGSEFGTATHPELHSLLVEYRASLEYYSASEELFFDARRDVVLHLASVMPAATVSAKTGIHGPSAFPVDVPVVLADPELEGPLGYLAVTATFLQVQAAALLDPTEQALAVLSPLEAS